MMIYSTLAATAALVGLAHGQGAGTQQAETHPRLTWSQCTGTGGNRCTTQNGEITLDANWRWLHNKNGYTNCYTGNEWNATICPDNASCSANCVVEGVDYQGTYGITTSGNGLTLKFVTKHQYGTSIGSRVYLMESATRYKLFNLNNMEFTFDVDVSQVACGLNGALYFVNMPAAGQGAAGAKYGTGYCDSQCPRDLKFINGRANVEGWVPSQSDENAGVGQRGACCAEMDIWEANSISNALTPHACDTETFTECSGDRCGGTYSGDRYGGTCDPNGCDYNPYRVGVHDFYGKGKTVDTSKKMTVVTQFISPGGNLAEIRRYYVQGGRVIEQPEPGYAGLPGNAITTAWCNAEAEVFAEEVYPFNNHGGMASMSRAFNRGMVLVMSLWGDHYANMEWLNSNYPPDADPSKPGVARGDCPNGQGDPDQLVNSVPNAQVVFSNIKFGPLGSTFAEPAARRIMREKRAAEILAKRNGEK